MTLSACVPYYDGDTSYYRSEVYTSPAPVYYGYGGGSYYSAPRGYYAPRYYQPAPRYYSAPRYYQPGPRYYSPPRAAYRSYPNRGGWDGYNRGGWNDDRGGGRGGRDHRGRGDHDGRGGHR
ncbi:hypothetical protein J2W59_001311 [Pseudomonas fluorescens]|nr:hypothetical protein [Pseudomonas fluorescens]